MFVCTRAELAPRTTSKVLYSLGLRRIRMLTAVSFVACLTACINPKHVGLENSGTIVGRVIDAATKDPIAAATISDELDRQAAADPSGAFSLMLPSGTHQLVIHADGYLTKRISIVVPSRATVLISKDGYLRMQTATTP